MASPTPTKAKTLRGWGELYYVTTAGEPAVETEHEICSGEATVTTSFSVDKTTSKVGASFATIRSDVTEWAMEIKVTTEQITDNILCIAAGLALETSLATAQAITGSITRKAKCRLKLYDNNNTSEEYIVIDGFTAVLTIDGDVLKAGKDGVSEVTVKADVEDVLGTIKRNDIYT